jgi:hypothetical protein
MGKQSPYCCIHLDKITAVAGASLTPEDLKDIFVKLQAANLDAVVVGGQAGTSFLNK